MAAVVTTLLMSAIVTVAALLNGVPQADAQEGDRPAPVRTADDLAGDGVAVAPSAEVDAAALRTVAARHPGIGFVVLSAESTTGAVEFADDVLDAAASAAPALHTVVVVSPTDYGAVSDRYADATIDDAFTGAVTLLRVDRVRGLDAFATALASSPTFASSDDDGSGDGGGNEGVVVLLVGVAAAVALVSWGLRRSGITGGGENGSDDDDGSSRSWWSRSSSSRRRSFGSFGSLRSSRRSRPTGSSHQRGRGGGRF